MQIVIVSDSPEQVGTLCALALDAGLKQVQGFNHPAAALDWCAEHQPDLVLADHMMRACDGLEFLRRFRALPHLAEVPVLLMLPQVAGLARVRSLAWKLGATDFLNLPVDSTEFVARLRTLLLLRDALRTRPRAGSFADRSLEAANSHWLDVPAAGQPGLAQFH